MPDQPYSGGRTARLHAAVLAAIQAYTGAPDGRLRLVKMRRLVDRDRWRSAGRRELMEGRGRDHGGGRS